MGIFKTNTVLVIKIVVVVTTTPKPEFRTQNFSCCNVILFNSFNDMFAT